ncbi:hypothetical protein KCK31_000425 [Clostridium perfringens]|nr:hypothetical protein [Clostridium perfringens]
MNLCFKGYIDDFLNIDKDSWILEMKNNFFKIYKLSLSNMQITAWKDCFDNLKEALKVFQSKR